MAFCKLRSGAFRTAGLRCSSPAAVAGTHWKRDSGIIRLARGGATAISFGDAPAYTGYDHRASMSNATLPDRVAGDGRPSVGNAGLTGRTSNFFLRIITIQIENQFRYCRIDGIGRRRGLQRTA